MSVCTSPTLSAVRVYREHRVTGRRGTRVASHRRSRQRGEHTTGREHRPTAQQAYLDWTPIRLGRWAQATGSATARLSRSSRRAPLPQQGCRACLGVRRLATRDGDARLEAACQRALPRQSDFVPERPVVPPDIPRRPCPHLAARRPTGEHRSAGVADSPPPGQQAGRDRSTSAAGFRFASFRSPVGRRPDGPRPAEPSADHPHTTVVVGVVAP